MSLRATTLEGGAFCGPAIAVEPPSPARWRACIMRP